MINFFMTAFDKDRVVDTVLNLVVVMLILVGTIPASAWLCVVLHMIGYYNAWVCQKKDERIAMLEKELISLVEAIYAQAEKAKENEVSKL